MARASAASGAGVSVRLSRARIMKATWLLSALPRPTAASFTQLGGYSMIRSPFSAAASTVAARAEPMLMAVRWDCT